jgi:DNA polymerase III subunit beta
MKIAVNAGELAGALALAAALSEDRRIKNIQSLEAVNLAADGQAITILANALDHALQLHIPATIEIPGALAVPGQRLAALAAGFSATETIHIGDGETTAHIACGRSRFRLPVIPQDELPAVPAIAQETGCVELAREEALTLFERPFFAAGTEATRYYLSGIFLRDTDDGALMAVATDGHRLAQVTVPGAAA